MKVRFLKSTPGASGNIRPGTVLDVSESEARLLMKTEYAVRAEPAYETPKKEAPKKRDKKES